jgi:hypothetical protein
MKFTAIIQIRYDETNYVVNTCRKIINAKTFDEAERIAVQDFQYGHPFLHSHLAAVLKGDVEVPKEFL